MAYKSHGSNTFQDTYRGYRLYANPETDSCRAIFHGNKKKSIKYSEHFPKKFDWPYFHMDMLKECVDAIYEFDLDTLHSYIDAYPKHIFGFEDYIRWVEKFQVEHRRGCRSLGPKPLDLTVEKENTILRVRKKNIQIHISAVLFKNQDQWVKICAHVGDDIFSEIYQEPSSSGTYVHKHYPQKYQALGLRSDLLEDIVGPHVIWGEWTDKTVTQDVQFADLPVR